MSEQVKKRIAEKIASAPVVVFMKGSPLLPQCGFSAQTVEVLRRAGVENPAYEDVLADPEIRQGIKEFTGWPTLPQVFVHGEFIGGCDVVTEMWQAGELAEKLGA